MAASLSTLSDYKRLSLALSRSLREQPSETLHLIRNYCQRDLFFLLWWTCGRSDVYHPWIFDRCKEVEKNPDGYLDLWSREHYKSTIITFGKTIQDLLVDSSRTFGIFSHTRPMAKDFLRQIKREFETNSTLKMCFPDVIWQNAARDAPKWSEDEGIILKRTSNPREASVEAWGVVDGQPIGKHFYGLVFDDIVTKQSVTTPEMLAKTSEMVELAYSLGSDGGVRRAIGTRYHFNDAYRTMLDRGSFVERIRLATSDGTLTGKLAIWSRETLDMKRRDMGPYTFACQIMQNPVSDAVMGFKRDWLLHYEQAPDDIRPGMNVYLLVDAANSKRKDSDYTVIWAVGLNADQNVYVLDIVRDRLNLTERTEKLIDLHRKWKPLQVRYESYGMQADIEHIKHVQKAENYRFNIESVGGQTPKNDRIRRLLPWFEGGRVYLPQTLVYRDYEGVRRDLVLSFIEDEYAAFPVSIHDDMLDSLARLVEPDIPLSWPRSEVEDKKKDRYQLKSDRSGVSAWAS